MVDEAQYLNLAQGYVDLAEAYISGIDAGLIDETVHEMEYISKKPKIDHFPYGGEAKNMQRGFEADCVFLDLPRERVIIRVTTSSGKVLNSLEVHHDSVAITEAFDELELWVLQHCIEVNYLDVVQDTTFCWDCSGFHKSLRHSYCSIEVVFGVEMHSLHDLQPQAGLVATAEHLVTATTPSPDLPSSYYIALLRQADERRRAQEPVQKSEPFETPTKMEEVD